MTRVYFVLGIVMLCSSVTAQEWDKLAPLPNQSGVAGAFAGVSHNSLLVAGGANFPEKKPWEGGKKVWHDEVFVLESPDGKWKQAGKLPQPLAYGISASYKDQLFCVGGSDATKHHAEVFSLNWIHNQLKIQNYPPLPVPIANACGTIWGSSLVIIGGQESPTASSALSHGFQLDLSNRQPEWKKLPPLPGEPRILATVAANQESLFVFGGAKLISQEDGSTSRKYLQDAYAYTQAAGWKRLPDLPEPLAASPSPAPVMQSKIYVFGGDNGSQLNSEPSAHTGFSKRILVFDLQKQNWQSIGELPAPRVTVPCVSWGNTWIVPSGEIRPGIRSPEVWRFTLPSQKSLPQP